jgi:hypothetical protein
MFDVSNGIIESLLGKSAGLSGIIHDFVVEDGEVKCESQTDGVCGAQFFSSSGLSISIRFKGTISSSLVFRASGVLSNISPVVTLHLQEEHLSFVGLFFFLSH